MKFNKLFVMFLCEVAVVVISFVCAVLCFVPQVEFAKPVLCVIFLGIAACTVVGKVFDPAFVKSVTTATGR